jgi:hypothetical protein
MANLLDPIVVPQGTWVDVYAETGITAGVAIEIQNLTSLRIRAVEYSSEPALTNGYHSFGPMEWAVLPAGNVGGWIYSSEGQAIVQVEEA